ncbi:Sulfur oxidation protein SoxY [invertebrate metagenome]|uniref:Sulfur oxidation protein SoxY n=1 Tax=invertebrate metagenome TaxID=1711999 RepID=A0A484H755_9ZZZZ
MLFATGTGILSVIHSGLELPVTFAAETEIDAWMESKLKGVHVKADRITLDIPEVAENGSSVQFTVTVDSPMTEQDYVKEVHVFAEGNATPYVASYYFTPYSGKAQVTARLRLAKKQYVRVLATMSNGSSYMTRKEVTVAIGGC